MVSLKPLKRFMGLAALLSLLLTFLAACGDTATPATTTNAATTAASSTTAAMTSAVAATTAAMTSATSMTSAAAMTSAAGATTAAATTSGGSSDLIETFKPDTTGKQGGQFVITFAGQFPSGMMPYYINDVVARIVANQAYSKLVGQDNNSKYYASMLTEVPTTDNGDVKINADNTMNVTLKLKPGLKWSDGSALTSKDVAYTWKWVTDPDQVGLQADLSPWQLVTGVDTPDDNTAVLNFKQVYGPYLNYLAYYWVLPQAVWSKIPVKSAQKDPQANLPTVTSGPMKISEFTPGDRVVLVRNDNYAPMWGFNSYLDKVIFRSTPDANSAIAAVSKGDVDEAENLDDNLVAAAAKVPNAKADIAQQFSWEFLRLNLSNPILQDKAVRQALDIAIDKQALIKQFRTPKTVQTPVDVVMPFSPFFDSALQPSKFDLDGAKKLLDDAGWKVGADGIRAKGSTKLAFVLSSTDAAVRKATGEVLTTYWKALGVDVRFQAYNSTQFFGSWSANGILQRGQYDVGMYALVGDVDPDSSFNRYYSTKIPTDANKGNGSNDGRINDPIIDKALNDERASADQAKRKTAWVALQDELSSQVLDIPLYTRVNNYVVSNKIHNFKANPASDGNYWNIFEVWVG